MEIGRKKIQFFFSLFLGKIKSQKSQPDEPLSSNKAFWPWGKRGNGDPPKPWPLLAQPSVFLIFPVNPFRKKKQEKGKRELIEKGNLIQMKIVQEQGRGPPDPKKEQGKLLNKKTQNPGFFIKGWGPPGVRGFPPPGAPNWNPSFLPLGGWPDFLWGDNRFGRKKDDPTKDEGWGDHTLPGFIAGAPFSPNKRKKGGKTTN